MSIYSKWTVEDTEELRNYFVPEIQKLVGEAKTVELLAVPYYGGKTIILEINGLCNMKGRKKPNTYYPPSIRISQLKLVELPGCCGVAVSTGLSVSHEYTNKGIGNLMQQIRDYVARRLNYGKIIATVVVGNKSEEHLLKKFGFVSTPEFTNPKTGHRIRLWEKDLV
jgi:hypothetical protein